MFAIDIWFINIMMIGFSLTAWIRLFSQIRPPHFWEHKTTFVSLLFISAITISTLIESVLQYAHFHWQIPIEHFWFVFISFMSFAYAFFTLVPAFHVTRERVQASFSRYYRFFFGGAVLLEALACFVFYLSWNHP